MSADPQLLYFCSLSRNDHGNPSVDPYGRLPEDYWRGTRPKMPAEDEAPTPLLPAPSTSRRADILEADTPPRKRLLLTITRLGVMRWREFVLLLRDSQDP
ncbi:hypothetical protein Tco_1361255 [Tanacetum coccineum]